MHQKIKAFLLLFNTLIRAHAHTTTKLLALVLLSREGTSQHLVHRVNLTALGRRKARQPEKN